MNPITQKARRGVRWRLSATLEISQVIPRAWSESSPAQVEAFEPGDSRSLDEPPPGGRELAPAEEELSEEQRMWLGRS